MGTTNHVPDKMTAQREQVVESLIDAMQRDGLSWSRGWASVASPHNFASGRPYHGINRLYLAYRAHAGGFNDPRWVTPKQALEIAAQRGETWDFAGEACTWVEWPVMRDVIACDEAGNPIVNPDTGKPEVSGQRLVGMKYHKVLNLAQIKGAPAYELPASSDGDFDAAQSIIDSYFPASGCGFEEAASIATPCYSPARDKVFMPSRNLFVSAEEFASTLAHETIHSTGAAKRLNRSMEGLFGSADYAYEELIAELGSVMLCSDLGFAYAPGEASLENHAAYLSGWMKALSSGKGFEILRKAQVASDRAATYVLGFLSGKEVK
ncbi:MAG: DUF1738 domain-containing protein [Eggerthellaceae bacterium]|nr:DUF1738 domain-containing protein [Eggerthellaceae bacterium]